MTFGTHDRDRFTAEWNQNGDFVERPEPFQREEPSPPPKVVHISLTDVCNLKCIHCEIPTLNPKGVGDLGLDDWKRLLDKYHAWLGPFVLKFAGGEPFVKRWLPDLMAHAKSLDLYVGVTTNGLLLKAPLVQRLSDIGLDEVNISLESLSPEIHDYTRARKGSHAAAVEALRNCRDAGNIQVNISTIMMEPNLDEIIDLAWWVKESGYRTLTLQPILQNFGEPYNAKWYVDSPLWPREVRKVWRLLDELREFRKKHWTIGNHDSQLVMMKFYFQNPELRPPEPCGAGKAEISIDPQGRVGLCFNLREVGDLKTQEPREIFESDEAYERREEIYHCSRNCYLLNCTMAETTLSSLLESRAQARAG